ncbi:hypothetical protein RJT34_13563 [Clitoria ternatea]|uniref:Apple domain-containing protein n=1 Tax=Clitoria ternatea TaxID=43366 RepID=A0AAN9JNS4_CLITE
MKITRNKRTGEEVRITSWKSHSDPSIGNFSLSFGTSSVPEGFVWNGTRPFWRTGPWNGQVFTGIPQMNSSYLNGYNVGDDGNETSYITFSYANESYLAMFVLNWQGKFGGRNWNAEKKEWEGGWNAQTSECDVYGTCGAFGICSSESSPICSCMQGFEPRNKEEWNEKNWASGCVRRTALQCETGKSQNGTGNSKGDGFLRQQMVKVPDFAEWSWVRAEDECRSQCLRNCNCFAYSYDAGIGCMSWSGNLVDTQQFTREGIDLYIRLANSDLPINGIVIVVILCLMRFFNFNFSLGIGL